MLARLSLGEYAKNEHIFLGSRNVREDPFFVCQSEVEELAHTFVSAFPVNPAPVHTKQNKYGVSRLSVRDDMSKILTEPSLFLETSRLLGAHKS